MTGKSLLFCLLLLSVTAFSQTPSKVYGEVITPSDLKENLTIISSDALEGRETGTRGQKMAAAFISQYFQELGLDAPVNGSFYQHFDLYKIIPGETYVSSGGMKYNNFKDVVYYGKDESGGEISVPIIFAGKGRSQDYEQVDVNGKAVMIMIGEGDDYRTPITVARSKNAKMVFILNTRTQDQFREYARNFEAFTSDSRLSLNKPSIASTHSGMFFIAPEVAEKMFNTSLTKLSEAASDDKPSGRKKIPSGKVSFKTSVELKTVRSENVLGYLEGSDKKDEIIVITAHYDHMGKERQGEGDLINNGADDDGSGTVAVLQLAKAFAQAKKDGHGPRRSILFMTVAGEEMGLLGSKHYTEDPVFPLANTVVNLNIDMIGRRDEQHRESPPYLYVIGADKLSTQLHVLSESVNNQNLKLAFDYTYNDQNHPARLYYRSDHWNFAQKNIPIIFYFDGIHEDYHKPSDEVDKIEFDLLTARSKCIFYTAWEIANRDERIRPDVK